LLRAAESIRDIAEDLETTAADGKRPRFQPDISGHPQDYFPTSPMAGYLNPIAPPVDIWAVKGEDGAMELRGRAFFDYPYEGPPTCVHGGVIAELFDELLGSANIINSRGGLTGRLTITYRQPTPLRSTLDLVARQTGGERRKVFTWGGIYHDGTLTAEAEGVFIEPDPAKMARMLTAHAAETRDVVDPQLLKFVEDGGQILAVEGTITKPPPS
jgi:hypothetical protein